VEPRDPIYDRLLEPEAMAAARAALISHYEWFLHRSACGNFESIQATNARQLGQKLGQVLGLLSLL
jgi:hypothetical protein